MNYFKLVFQSINESVSYLQEIIDQHEFANVVVYNDSINDFNDVVNYLTTAIPEITYSKAQKLANKIHNTGKAVVYSGLLESSRKIANQLYQKGLDVQIERF